MPGRPARIPPGALLTLALVVALVLAGVAVLAELNDRPLGDLTRDPLTIARRDSDVLLPRYIGFLSNLGVVVLAIAAGSALVGALVLRGHTQAWRFLAAGAALTGVVLLDDLFQVHEWLARRDFPDFASFGILALLSAAFLYRNRTMVLERTFLPLLLVAGAFFGLSLSVDAGLLPDEYFLEDSFKFAGIVAWSTWLVTASAALLSAGVDSGRD